MELISSLVTDLDLDRALAEAVAGTVLGTTREQLPPGDAVQLEEAVPELHDWSHQARVLLGRTVELGPIPTSGGFSDYLGSQEHVGDARQTAALVVLLGKLGVEPSKAIQAAPMALSFLKTRLPPDWIDRAMAAAPVLAGTSSSGAADVFGQLLG